MCTMLDRRIRSGCIRVSDLQGWLGLMDGEDGIKDDQLDAGEGKNNDPCRLHGGGLCEG